MSYGRNIRIVLVLNRTTTPLESTWDGYTYVIPPGFKSIEVEELRPKLNARGAPVLDDAKEPILEPVRVTKIVGNTPHGDVYLYPMPYFAAEAAMRQNPKLGTLNPLNPTDFEPLICVPEWGHPIEHTEQADASHVELLDRGQLPANRQNVMHEYVPGSRRTAQRSNKWSAYGGRGELAVTHGNPFGMQGDGMAGSAEFGR